MATFRTLLKSKGITLTEFALKLGVSKSYAQYMLDNGVPAKWIIKAEKATGISRHDIDERLYPRDNGYHNGGKNDRRRRVRKV